MSAKRLAGTCIFCGRTGVTKEHVIPLWVAEAVPRGAADHHVSSGDLVDTVTGVATPIHDVRVKQGHMFTRQIRKVCGGAIRPDQTRPCNNGWMSDLERRAKPLLLPMMRGEKLVLSTADQLVAATWITKTAMVFEYVLHETSVVSSQADREQIMKNLQAPDHWQVFIASLRPGRWSAGATRDVATLAPKSAPTVPPNTQMVVFGIGKLLCITFSSTLAMSLDLPPGFDGDVRQIWPAKFDQIEWPCRKVFYDPDVDHFRDGFAREVVYPHRPGR